MRLIIYGIVVTLAYLPYEGGRGHIAQLFFEACPAGEYVHGEMNTILRAAFSGVMDEEKPNADGRTEIRVLNRTHLEIVDTIRSAGWGVKESTEHLDTSRATP